MGLPTRKKAAAALLVLCCLFVVSFPQMAAAQADAPDSLGDETVREALAGILAAGFQTRLPGPDPAGEQEQAPPDPGFRLPGWLAALLEFSLRSLLVLAFGVGLVLLVFWLYSDFLAERLRQWGERRAAGRSEGGQAPGRPPGSRPDARRLAAEGRFAEAIHVLLLAALEALNKGREIPLPDSLTSREVCSRLNLPGGSRQALSRLVLAVEISHFGGAEPSDEDYRDCLAAYERLFARQEGGNP